MCGRYLFNIIPEKKFNQVEIFIVVMYERVKFLVIKLNSVR